MTILHAFISSRLHNSNSLCTCLSHKCAKLSGEAFNRIQEKWPHHTCLGLLLELLRQSSIICSWGAAENYRWQSIRTHSSEAIWNEQEIRWVLLWPLLNLFFRHTFIRELFLILLYFYPLSFCWQHCCWFSAFLFVFMICLLWSCCVGVTWVL